MEVKVEVGVKRKLTSEEDNDLEIAKKRQKLSHVEERSVVREMQREQRQELREKGFEVQPQPLREEENEFRRVISATRTGGVYIPPFKLRRQLPLISDTKSVEYQRKHWDALKKSLNGLINKVNYENVKSIILELFQENIVRGRGLLARSILKSQLASPMFTNVYAALLSVINTKMPEIGELVLKRLIHYFRRAYQRNDKIKCVALLKFIAHLLNQRVAHEVLGGQIFALLLETPTNDSVELSVNFMKDCGAVLNEVSPKIIHAVFERLRSILAEGKLCKRVQYMIEGLFLVRKSNFADYPAIRKELDLIELDDQYTHDLELDEDVSIEDELDYFQVDKDFEKHENEYGQIRKEILGEGDSDDEDEEDGDGGEDADGEESDEEEEEAAIQNKFEKTQEDYALEIIKLKKAIYLTIVSCVDYQECIHKLLQQNLCEGHEMEICSMIIECCAEETTYLRFFGLMGQRFCELDRIYQEKFEECFRINYSMIHRFETNKLRNIAKLFAHILATDALTWAVMENIKIKEEETTSSCRIFVKILFQELAEIMGMKKLKAKLEDEYLQEHFEGLFPTETTKQIRYAINFWTQVGLGQLTIELRKYLKGVEEKRSLMGGADGGSSSSSSSDSSDSDSDSDSD